MVKNETAIKVGTAPDSWGVWYPDTPDQIPWRRFLDEVQQLGYHWIELGPFGYMPKEAQLLKGELDSRDLTLSAGTVFTSFHHDDWTASRKNALEVAEFVSQLGVKDLVVIPDFWRNTDPAGEVIEPRTLTNEQWARLCSGHDALGRELYEKFDIRQQFHPHADTHVGTYLEVERFLENTDEQYTNLCLDVGHFAYYAGDNLQLIKAFPSRVRYLHLKQVDPRKISDVLKNDTSFYDAVMQDIMVEPPFGVPEYAPIIEAVAALHPGAFAIIEQDMYGCSHDRPFGVSQRTKEHILKTCRSVIF